MRIVFKDTGLAGQQRTGKSGPACWQGLQVSIYSSLSVVQYRGIKA